jgi:hypothetical protein
LEKLFLKIFALRINATLFHQNEREMEKEEEEENERKKCLKTF